MLRCVFAVLVLLLAALPARGDRWIYKHIPRDPDFFIEHDFETQDAPPMPMPDLSKRPPPRDARTLSGDFAPDPQGTLRYYTVGGSTSSTCIGDPVTAPCAIETDIASSYEGNRRLAEISLGPFAKYFWLGGKPWPKGFTVIYRIYEIKRIGPDDLKGPRPYDVNVWYPSWFDPERPWQEGDLQILVLRMRCKSPTAETCSWGLAPVCYTVRQIARDRWAVLDVHITPY